MNPNKTHGPLSAMVPERSGWALDKPPSGVEPMHRGPPSGFAVQRYERFVDDRLRMCAYDVVYSKEIENGESLTIHWPEQEESRVIWIEESMDRHGTMHHRAYFEIKHYGAPIRIYLRDVQRFVSILR